MSLRRAVSTGWHLLHTGEQLSHTGLVQDAVLRPCRSCISRMFAKLPYESASHSKLTLRDPASFVPPPPRKAPNRPSAEVPEVDMMREAAKAVTATMLPWERRQMDGGATGLNKWERFYWGAFATAVAFLLGMQVYKSFEKPPPKVDEQREQKKEDLGIKLAKGEVNITECEDYFEGMSPTDIVAFTEQAAQKRRDAARASEDVYDGLTPEEINAMAAQGLHREQ